MIERVQGLVELPAPPVIAQPPAPCGDVAKIRLVPVGKAKGERFVGEGGRARFLVGLFRRAFRVGFVVLQIFVRLANPRLEPTRECGPGGALAVVPQEAAGMGCREQAQFDFTPIKPATRDHATETVGAGVQGFVAFPLSCRGQVCDAAFERCTSPGLLARAAALRPKPKAAGAVVRLALGLSPDQPVKPGRRFGDLKEVRRGLPPPFRAVLALRWPDNEVSARAPDIEPVRQAAGAIREPGARDPMRRGGGARRAVLRPRPSATTARAQPRGGLARPARRGPFRDRSPHPAPRRRSPLRSGWRSTRSETAATTLRSGPDRSSRP